MSIHRHLILLLLLALVPAQLPAAHITDKLIAGLYVEPDDSKDPVKGLPSGTPIETLEEKGDFTLVRLGDGNTGWVESRYITNEKPARVMLLELQARYSTSQEKLRVSEQQLRQLGGDEPATGTGESREITGMRQQLTDLKAENELLKSEKEKLAESVNRDTQQKRIAELEQMLEAAKQELEIERQQNSGGSRTQALADENRELRKRIAEAAALLGTDPGQAPEVSEPFRPSVWHLPALAFALLISFIGGVAFKNYRLAKRYGGFRL